MKDEFFVALWIVGVDIVNPDLFNLFNHDLLEPSETAFFINFSNNLDLEEALHLFGQFLVELWEFIQQFLYFLLENQNR